MTWKWEIWLYFPTQSNAHPYPWSSVTLTVDPCSAGSAWSCCSPGLCGVGSAQEESSSSGLRRGFLLPSCREYLDPSGEFSSVDGKCWPQRHWMTVTALPHYCSLLPLPSNHEKLTLSTSPERGPTGLSIVRILRVIIGERVAGFNLGTVWLLGLSHRITSPHSAGEHLESVKVRS